VFIASTGIAGLLILHFSFAAMFLLCLIPLVLLRVEQSRVQQARHAPCAVDWLLARLARRSGAV
jgi:hypothetical protein